jgi:thiol-disulfide isomerase/thioredoxin
MAETPSTMLPLGTPLPPLRLSDAVSGRTVDAVLEARGKSGLLVAFICNHCPFVKHIRKQLIRVVHDALDRGFAAVAVNSNDPRAFPQDGPEAMRRLAREEGWRFPFLFDESQDVAKAFRAACTPDFFLFDGQLRLAYRGQFDDSRPSNDVPVTGTSLAAAIEAVAQHRGPDADQRPSIGCNIKWKPDSAPSYFGRP